ncbi:TetR/AcrR family transcriptional regulator [Rhodopseudomonas sp. B29]|uniref:TetR/AcrR family transcriptional regulator n=1 Tax=Rhodopseudomonas sp. B29 TaxID=95607 RepID=UPI0003B55F65|nr:TetR family transcriptional regulator [Rhodopseudomonas sp. B29]
MQRSPGGGGAKGGDVSPRERDLLEATLRVIGRSGIDAVTHRAVATEAGTSLGAVTHHFAKRDDLTDGALRFAVRREMTRLDALALALQEQAFDPPRWIAQLVGWYAAELRTNSETHIACYEAFLAAARHAQFRSLVEDLFAVWKRSAALAFRAAGADDADAAAAIFVSTLMGLLLRQLAGPRRSFQKETEATLGRLFLALTASGSPARGVAGK